MVKSEHLHNPFMKIHNWIQSTSSFENIICFGYVLDTLNSKPVKLYCVHLWTLFRLLTMS